MRSGSWSRRRTPLPPGGAGGEHGGERVDVVGQARGLGIGHRLVEECIRFAKQCRYEKITLWTHAELIGARRIYEQAGFTLVKTWTHSDFGKELVAETWDLPL